MTVALIDLIFINLPASLSPCLTKEKTEVNHKKKRRLLHRAGGSSQRAALVIFHIPLGLV